jgi:hypothetical protein
MPRPSPIHNSISKLYLVLILRCGRPPQVHVGAGRVGCVAKLVDLGQARSINSLALRELERVAARPCIGPIAPDAHVLAEIVQAAAAPQQSPVVGVGGLEGALALAEFGSCGESDERAGPRVYGHRQRDGSMWMQIRRRRRPFEEPNRFLDFLLNAQVVLSAFLPTHSLLVSACQHLPCWCLHGHTSTFPCSRLITAFHRIPHRMQPPGKCAFVHPERLDQFALGVVVYESPPPPSPNTTSS